jgi:hypothetical protein
MVINLVLPLVPHFRIRIHLAGFVTIKALRQIALYEAAEAASLRLVVQWQECYVSVCAGGRIG